MTGDGIRKRACAVAVHPRQHLIDPVPPEDLADAADRLEAVPCVELERSAHMLQVRVASQLPATTGRLHQHPSREPEGGVIAEATEEALVVIGRELDVAVQLPHMGEGGGQAQPIVECARLGGVMEPIGSGGERYRGRLNDSHKRNVLHCSPQQIKGAVVGSIVDHDPFVGWSSLTLHAPHDGFDMPRFVKDGRDDGQALFAHATRSTPLAGDVLPSRVRITYRQREGRRSERACFCRKSGRIAAFVGCGADKADLPLRGRSVSDTGTEAWLEPETRLSRHPCRWRPAAAAAAALLPILLLAACGGSSQAVRGLRGAHLVGTCASRTCASATAVLYGGLPGSRSARAYALYVDGRQRGVEQAPPFGFGTLHCGIEYGLAVVERGRSGPDRTLYATRYRAPACRGAVVVGTDGVPDVACNQTVRSGADLGTVLSDAAAGSTVCLSAGSWARQVINNVNPAGTVTVASAPGQTAEVGGLTLALAGAVSNLTFEGIRFSGGVEVDGTAHSLLFRFDDFQDIRDEYAFNFRPFASGRSAVDDGVTISYDQIDHVSECLQMDGGETEIVNFTFSHNVCGPGIGYGEDPSFGAHYIQTDGVNGFDVVNNAFEGPPDPRTVTYGNHLNVLHVWGSSREHRLLQQRHLARAHDRADDPAGRQHLPKQVERNHHKQQSRRRGPDVRAGIQLSRLCHGQLSRARDDVDAQHDRRKHMGRRPGLAGELHLGVLSIVDQHDR